MRKTVDLFMIPDDPGCLEVREFLQQQDVRLLIHDIQKNPLNVEEINRLFRHFNLRQFLNSSSKVYSKRRLDSFLPERDELVKMMAEDNDLIKRPVVLAGRLMVVGPNRAKIIEMLQIKSNGSDPTKDNSSAKEGKA